MIVLAGIKLRKQCALEFPCAIVCEEVGISPSLGPDPRGPPTTVVVRGVVYSDNSLVRLGAAEPGIVSRGVGDGTE